MRKFCIMDPKAQFEARYKAYIEKRNLSLNQAHIKEAEHIVQGSPGGPKIKFGYALFAILAIAVPATVLLLGQQQDIRQRASGPETAVPQGAIKQVGTSYITNSDVDLRLQQIYGTNSAKFKDDISARQTIINQLIRERIIQQEAAKQNITVTDREIDDKAHELSLTPPFDRTKIFNMIMEDKLKNKVVAWRIVDYAFIFRSTIKPDYSTNAVKIKKSYDLIKAGIQSGKTIKQAFDEAKDTSGFDKAITITENKKVTKTDFDKNTAEKIFALKKEETSDTLDTGGGSFFLVKVLDTNNAQYSTFEDWFKAVEQTSVK